MEAGCYSVINPKEKKPDEKGILENWKLFHFQNWKFRKGGLLPLDNTEFKLNMLVVLQMKVPMMKAFINKSIQ